MNWEVVTELTPPVILVHWVTALAAFALGIVILMRRKGTGSHMAIGLAYVVLMVVTSVAAFFIRSGEVSGLEYLSFKGMSWIHIFVFTTLFGIVSGLLAALVWGKPKAHRGALLATFIGGLVVAGTFTFVPGRRMHLLFFGDEARVESMVERSADAKREGEVR